MQPTRRDMRLQLRLDLLDHLETITQAHHAALVLGLEKHVQIRGCQIGKRVMQQWMLQQHARITRAQVSFLWRQDQLLSSMLRAP